MFTVNKYIKSILVKFATSLLVFFVFIVFFPNNSKSQIIWVTRLTNGQPIATYYLGDKINSGSNWYFNFEIGQATWNSSQVGIGQNSDGNTGWNYSDAIYYEDGSGSNKRVRRDVAEFQFTATGTWYVTGRARANSGDAYTYADETGWTNDQNFTTTNASYWTVNSLSPPTSPTSTVASSSQINLSWTKWNSKNVMVVRSTSSSFTAPTQGTTYLVGSTIGSGTVVYNGSGTSFEDTGLDSGTTYYYAYYSENYSYYSDASTANASTLKKFRSKTSGNWDSNSSWEMTSSGSWIDATSTPTSSDDSIFIRGSHIITLASNVSAKNLVLESGSTLSLSTYTLNILDNGMIINYSTLNPETGTINFVGSGTIAGTSTVNLFNVILNGAVDFGPSLSLISGVLTLNNLSYVNTNAPIYSSGSTLKYNSGAIYERRVEWDNVGTVGLTPGQPYNVLITNNTTIDYPNTDAAAFSTALEIGGNLTIDAGSSLFMAYGDNNNKSGKLTVHGNVTINGNLGLGDALGGDIIVKGNWTRGAGSNFYPNERAVMFTGTADQTINSSGGELFDYVILDNSNNLILTSNATIEEKLEMTSGNINTGSNLLTIGTSTMEKGEITYTSGSIYGQVARWFDGTNSGDASGFVPLGYLNDDRFVTVEYSSAPTSGGTLTFRWVEAEMGTAGLPITVTAAGSCLAFDAVNTSDDGYWQIDTGNGLTNDGNYDITLVGENVFGINDLCKLTTLKRVGGGNWQRSGTHNEPTGTILRPILKSSGATGWSNWGIGGGAENPLPIKLSSFKSECNSNGILITWTTESETNNDFFTLEKSDDMNKWYQLESIEGAGDSNKTISYQYLDQKPKLETNYYRLKQTDFDGSFTYSQVISSSCLTYKREPIIYPNPSNGIIYISGITENESPSKIIIRDNTGKIVYIAEFSGDSINSINLSHLQPGIYYLGIYSEMQVDVSKIIITK